MSIRADPRTAQVETLGACPSHDRNFEQYGFAKLNQTESAETIQKSAVKPRAVERIRSFET